MIAIAPTVQPLPDQKVLSRLLDATDEFAAANVKADRGGPFGASVHIYNARTGELIDVGGLRANAVLSTGIASAHAEDQALTPDIVNALKEKLAKMDKADISVVMMSSAESCPACHAKEEIVAHELIHEGLLNPGRFFVVYGATYQDSKEVAGFNDEPYHLDMQKPPAERMIHVHARGVSEVPAGVVRAFNRARGQDIAVVALKDGTLVVGRDDTLHDLRATPESMAIQAACRYQKDKGMKTPWDLGGATLYTKSHSIGPLGYAEAQWANVTDWTTLNKTGGVYEPRCSEARDVSNRQLFAAVAAKPYNQPGSAITVIHLTPYANKAQHVWHDKLAATAHPEDILYNGIK